MHISRLEGASVFHVPSFLTEFPRHLSIHLGIVENNDYSYDSGDTLNTNERKVFYSMEKIAYRRRLYAKRLFK